MREEIIHEELLEEGDVVYVSLNGHTLGAEMLALEWVVEKEDDVGLYLRMPNVDDDTAMKGTLFIPQRLRMELIPMVKIQQGGIHHIALTLTIKQEKHNA